jgi:probable rRNA maturation factor
MAHSGAVDVQVATTIAGLPDAASIRRWARAVMRAEHGVGAISIRLMDEAEMSALNARFRGKSGPTNVLSFPAGDTVATSILGDVAICMPLVEREAIAQGKTLHDHCAHLVVHGVLHLLGYDHESKGDARAMEAKEVTILAGFAIPDPYRAGERRGRG